MNLVVGYGNSMRSDDGVGIYIGEKIARLNLPHTNTLLTQQLQAELVDELVKYDKIIFVDVSTGGPEIEIKKIDPIGSLGADASHFMKPEVFLSLAESLYGKKLNVYVCSVKGEHFEFGSNLSENVLKKADQAVVLIEHMMTVGQHA